MKKQPAINRLMLSALVTSALIAGLIPTPQAQAQTAPLLTVEPQIIWRVKNPLRFFRSSVAADMHRRTLANLTERERETPILAVEYRLGERFPRGWSEMVYRDTCWDRAKASFSRCGDRQSYFRPKRHRVIARIATRRLRPLTCTWLIEPPRNTGKPQIINKPCDRAVEFNLPYPNGARVSVSAGDGTPLSQTRMAVKDLFIASMGDSFASGEGNPDKPIQLSGKRTISYGPSASGKDLSRLPARQGNWASLTDRRFRRGDAQWMSAACHRSLYSHHVRAALHLALEDPHRAVTFTSYACAGAEIEKGLFLRYRGSTWTPNPPKLSQISALAEAQCGGVRLPDENFPDAYRMGAKLPDLANVFLRRCPRDRSRAIDLLFLSIGGNDVGFAGLVANAILSDASKLRQVGGWLGAVISEDEAQLRLSGLTARYRTLNRALHNILHIPWKQSDRILLTAYPLLATRSDRRSLCPDSRLGLEVFPDFRLNRERARQSNAVADKLYRFQRKAAAAFGWTFVDAHRAQFAGHSVCSGNDSIEISPDDDLRMPRKTKAGWRPYNPSRFRPYAPRRRWFRTPNDAYLTANSHMLRGKKLLSFQKLQWFQLLFSATYSGAFHPNALGQAAMADALANQARGVLTKYRAREAGYPTPAPSMRDETVSSGPLTPLEQPSPSFNGDPGTSYR